jgi:beta-N-acetylhexosaminidase
MPGPEPLSLDEKIGQLFLVGFPAGDEGLASFKERLSKRPFGNIILFSRNIADITGVYRQNARLREALMRRCGLAPFIAVDQEGGIVARIVEGLTPLPGAMALGAALGGGAAIGEVAALADVNGRELAALGFNFNLAPVADVNINPANPVIGVRSFGEDPESVAALASAYARGLSAQGVLACAKHFPGHGDTTVDSHLGLPLVSATRKRLGEVELAPFRRLISEGIPAIMSAHVLFPSVEPEELPATLSARVLTGLLREAMGFSGLIVTDCLEMKAVHERYDDLALRAFLAGADLLCISHTVALQDEAFDSIKRAVLDGRLSMERLDASIARISAAKKIMAAPAADEALAMKALRAPAALELSERLSRLSLSVIQCAARGGRFGASGWLAEGGCYIDILPDNLTGVEDAALRPMTVSSCLESMDSGVLCIRLPQNPSPVDIGRCIAMLREGAVALGLYAPEKNEGQRLLLSALANERRVRRLDIACLSMRSPYDAALVADTLGADTPLACAYEYSEGSARAAADFLHGSLDAHGRCPVRALSPAGKGPRAAVGA